MPALILPEEDKSMIQVQTMLNVADNTGVKKIMCIGVLGGTRRKYARIGDIITASVKESVPNSSIRKGETVRAVIVRTAKGYRRPDGSYIQFDENDAVIIDEQKQPRGTRIFGPVARELRDKQLLELFH